MDLLLDNDIIVRMAHFDLCDQMVSALGGDRSSVYILRSARHVLGVLGKRSSQAKRSYPPEVYERLTNFMMGRQEIYDTHDDDLSKLINVDNIHIGEATLATAVCSADSLIVSAERVFLEAIGSCEGCESAIARIRGRWVCFEQVLYKLIQTQGFELVRNRVVPVMDVDHRLRAFFGSGMASTEQNVIDGLKNYISHWNKASGGILAAIP